MKPIATKWDLFVTLCMPSPVSAMQYQAMRRAFYAGVEVMQAINGAVAEMKKEDAAVKVLMSVTKELEQFSKDIQAGKA